MYLLAAALHTSLYGLETKKQEMEELRVFFLTMWAWFQYLGQHILHLQEENIMSMHEVCKPMFLLGVNGAQTWEF